MNQNKTILNVEKKILQSDINDDDITEFWLDNMYKELSKELEENIREGISEEFNKLISNSFYDKTSECTSSTKTSDIDFEKLQELYNNLNKSNIHKEISDYTNKYITDEILNQASFNTQDNNSYRYLYSYGMPVIQPTRTIQIQVQKRKHKSKRINKKWLKKYGYKFIDKKVPNYGFIYSCGV